MSTIYGMTVTFGGGSSETVTPRITVNAPTGSTVTATKGDVTLTATESSGVWVFELPEFGTWVITATNGTKTATETIVMDSTRAVSMSYFSATITATYPAGSTCTCSNGATTLTAPDTSGSCTFVITGAGAWTVACTDGESYVAKSVSITKDGQAATCKLEYPSAAPVLLWTNASPTSNFAVQNVTVNGNGYSSYLIEVRFSTSDANTGVGLIPIGGKGAIGAINSYGVAPYATRAVLGTSASSVNFGGAAHGGTADTTKGIPIRIWGVKFTL